MGANNEVPTLAEAESVIRRERARNSLAPLAAAALSAGLVGYAALIALGARHLDWLSAVVVLIVAFGSWVTEGYRGVRSAPGGLLVVLVVAILLSLLPLSMFVGPLAVASLAIVVLGWLRRDLWTVLMPPVVLVLTLPPVRNLLDRSIEGTSGWYAFVLIVAAALYLVTAVVLRGKAR